MADSVTDVTNAAFAKAQADQAAALSSPQAKNFRFAVSLGLLAYGVWKKNVYVGLIGGGFLAYWFYTGQV